MKYLKFLVFILFSFFYSAAFGQSSGTAQEQYTHGKALFKQGKYESAMDVFAKLANENANHPFVEYASFYYALSALDAGQTAPAKNMFLQIFQKFPSWEKIDEVHYWLGKIYLDEANYAEAFDHLQEITGKGTKADAQAMTLHYIDQINDAGKLQRIFEENPDNKEIGMLIAKRISNMPLANQNQELLEFIVQEFELDMSHYDRADYGDSEKKLSYNVAVLLPFLYKELAASKNVGNQFVLDLYQGILMGLQKVNSEGANIQLFAYDTRRDSATTAKLLQQEGMQAMDLIIGPLYPVPSKLVSEFSFRHQINMVNPISNNSEVIGNNPFSFLWKPSYKTQAEKAAEFASTEFDNKKALIIYGTSPNDSVSAFAYKEKAEELGIEIIQMHQVDASKVEKVSDILSVSEEGEGEEGEEVEEEIEESIYLQNEEVGHIFVASSDEIIIANIISALENRNDEIALIGSEDWLDFRFLTYDQLERLRVYILAPNLVNIGNEDVENFRNNYIDQTKSLPSSFTYNGYEMMVFVGETLMEYGTYFQKESENVGLQKGNILPAHSFAGANDNQYVPIIKLVDADIVLANPVQ